MLYISHVRATVRLIACMAWFAVLIPVQAVNLALGRKFARKWPITVYRVFNRLLGIGLKVAGKPVKKGPVLYVVNHTSYADIPVLGALLEACFVAKAEVAGWPLFGLCAKISGTVFVDRNPRLAVRQSELLKQRLTAGDSLVLFPEGTSSDGNFVLPFRSALFSAAAIRIGDRPVVVQPVSVAYTHLDGIPMGRHLRPFFAWYGDMEMAGHLWQLLGIGRSRVEVRFHDPVNIDRFASRKDLSAWCHAVIAAGVARSLTGRDQPVGVGPPLPAVRTDAGGAAPSAGPDRAGKAAA
ncbi:MAG: lysophospholipid acyltransferase family protein [Rhodospirillaceae bacterium]|nr:lysophospholipid acyltransferase family protein [Rhodospirillaceae bacterium]MDE0618705.1 lysophospholipid acyltransferase family protein [Rhodospirillaceae bacterium]